MSEPGPMPSEGEAARRPRTAWRIRYRFKVAQRLLAGLGGVLAAVWVGAALAALPDPQLALERSFALPAALVLAAGIAGPWLIVGALWRRARRRHLAEWGGHAPF